jgi:UbiD family decarboxylase
MAYADLREYVSVLEERRRLHHVTAEVDKDWEIAALCRRVFQRIPEKRRPVLIFDRVKGFDIPLLVGSLGASPEVYSIALQCAVEEIGSRWEEAQLHPIKPVRVSNGPCKERVLRNEAADLTLFPHPIWTVGHDPGPYITAPCIVTKDPETGIYNVGTYRLQVKERRKLGLWAAEGQHLSMHRRKYEAKREAMPVAVVLGAEPTIEMVSVTKFSPVTQEYDIAGGLRREPVALVPCETVPLEVPATAEIVIEGEVPPGVREPEGPFGEYTGYMGAGGDMPVIRVRCITHRQRPIYRAFFSQMPPSESSCIRRTGWEQAMLKHLKDDLGLPVRDLHLPESGGATGWMVISIKKNHGWQVKEVVHAAMGFASPFGKFIVVVDEDVDVRDYFQVEWAMSFHVQPERDIDIVRGVKAIGLDPSQAPPEVPQGDPSRWVSSKAVIDATRKHAFPPLALPPKEHLQRVDARWEKYGLPVEG